MKNSFLPSLMACAALALPAARGETGANIVVDGRGLPQVQGVLRDGNKVDWGFANFVAFGPGCWAYTAQDYAAKEHKKAAIDDPALGRGLLFTGKIWAGSRGLAIREEFFDVSKGGPAKARVRWTISAQDGKPMQLERAYVRFPLALNDVPGGTLSGKPLPEAYGQEWIGVGDKGAIEVVSKDGSFASPSRRAIRCFGTAARTSSTGSSCASTSRTRRARRARRSSSTSPARSPTRSRRAGAS